MAGRPTVLTNELVGKASYYLDSCKDDWSDDRGYRPYEKLIAAKLPSIEGLALHLSVHRDTLYSWESQANWDQPESLFCQFSDILAQVRNQQAVRLIDGGLTGKYNSTIAKLLLSSKHDYVEKSDLTSGGKSITPSAESSALAEQVLNKFLNKNEEASPLSPTEDKGLKAPPTPAGVTIAGQGSGPKEVKPDAGTNSTNTPPAGN